MEPIQFIYTQPVPLEMHKARIIQKLTLLPLEERLKTLKQAYYNLHLLKNEDIFLDMLTDSGVNAMSDMQLAAMMQADDAYAGSRSFYRLEEAVKNVFGMPYFLPAHQGRACEHLLAWVYVKDGMTVPMNYHFTTARALIEKAGGKVVELVADAGLQPQSDVPFKGDMDIEQLKACIAQTGKQGIAFVRLELGTNLIGGQPVSMQNIEDVAGVCKANGLKLVMDASLLTDNVYFIKVRDPKYKSASVRDIIARISKYSDILYFSGRKLTSARGGGICFRDEETFKQFRDLTPLYEGFSTYGGMSVREIEAMAVGLKESLDFDMISQGPLFIAEMTRELAANGVPVVTPAGGLGVHLDCAQFAPHIDPHSYPAAAVACALYLVSGIRGAERGTMSEERDENGEEPVANMELLRLALPRRVFTLSHIRYAVDRITWLYRHRDLIGGLRFSDEPKMLRFFFGEIEPVGGWMERLVKAFKQAFGDGL